jgi:hypothetical protein
MRFCARPEKQKAHPFLSARGGDTGVNLNFNDGKYLRCSRYWTLDFRLIPEIVVAVYFPDLNIPNVERFN